jgi:hypothetical protein
LWKQDELITEEEKALVTRGFDVIWKARKRYPRGLSRPIPIVAEFGVPFLDNIGGGVSPSNLEWSARILGSDRASLETFGDWIAGKGRVAFEVDPRELATNGPHRRALHAKVRTVGLTTNWELEMPQVPFTFEFDPNLAPDALLASNDEAREAALASALRLSVVDTGDGEGQFSPLNTAFAIRGRLRLGIAANLPIDLAHAAEFEVEGMTHPIAAPGIVALREADAGEIRFDIEGAIPDDAIDKPGTRRVRLVLVPDVHRAWSEPGVRSLWPGTIVTPWQEIEVVRR